MFILIRISDSIKDNSPALFHLRQIHPGTGYGKKNNMQLDEIALSSDVIPGMDGEVVWR